MVMKEEFEVTMRLCKVGSHTFAWDGKALTLVRKVNGKYVHMGRYDPEKDEFLGMSDAARKDAKAAHSILSVIPPQIEIQTV